MSEINLDKKPECACRQTAAKITGGVRKIYDYLKNAVLNTDDHTDEFSADDVDKNRPFAIAAYFSILFLVPLLLAKDSRFARFHANQGILLTIVSVIAVLALLIVGVVLLPIPFLGIFLYVIISAAVYLSLLGLLIFGVYNVIYGFAKDLPFFGKHRILPNESAAE